MPTTRRLILALPLALPVLTRFQPAAAADALTPRSVGKPDAKVEIMEFYSLTCPHCARFARDVMPRLHTELIEPGKLRWTYQDFPLDQVALAAAQVARTLPADRYEPFIMDLLASQDRWVYARGVNHTEELAKRAAQAGMSREAFDAAIADTALRDAILTGADQAQKTYGVDSTPTFIVNGPSSKNRRESGEKSFDEIASYVAAAAGTS